VEEIEKFKTTLRNFLSQKALLIVNQDKLKEIFAEFYRKFTGKNLPMRKQMIK